MEYFCGAKFLRFCLKNMRINFRRCYFSLSFIATKNITANVSFRRIDTSSNAPIGLNKQSGMTFRPKKKSGF